MRHKFLTSLISIVVVLATCSFAYGQPAWILWSKKTVMLPEYRSFPWGMLEAFPDYERCMLGMKKHWGKERDSHQSVLSKTGFRNLDEIVEKMRLPIIEKEGLSREEAIEEEIKRLDEMIKELGDVERGRYGRVAGKPYEEISVHFTEGKEVFPRTPWEGYYTIEFKCFPDTIDPRKK